MQRGLQHHARTIRIPVHIGQELTKIRAAERKLTTELGRDPTLEELAAKRSSMDPDQIEELRSAERVPVSLETPVGSDGDDRARLDAALGGAHPARGGRRRARGGLDPQGARAARLERPQGDRAALRDRRREPLTLREVAQRMGLSAEGVRKLERRALRRLAEERELQALAA